jgi:phosphoenolpyruvate synthase/pyruvate phosphate dikinase
MKHLNQNNMTAVEWLIDEWLHLDAEFDMVLIDKKIYWEKLKEKQNQAKEMEKKELFLASNTSAKEAYEAGQKSMYCGCYEVSGCPTYEEWLYETFKSE